MGIMVIMYALAVAVMAAVVSYTMIQEVKKKEILTEKEIRRSQIIELMLKVQMLEDRMKKEAESDKTNE